MSHTAALRGSGGRQQPATVCGQALAIHLSDGDATAQWQLDVDVDVCGGIFRLGTITTATPAASGSKARVVALAFVPGAEAWRVYGRPIVGIPTTSMAELTLSAKDCCPGISGLVAITPFASASSGGGGGGGGAVTLATVTRVLDSAATQLLAAANLSRKGLSIWNDSTEVLFVKMGSAAGLADASVRLVQQAFYELSPATYPGEIHGIWSANAAGAAEITEYT